MGNCTNCDTKEETISSQININNNIQPILLMKNEEKKKFEEHCPSDNTARKINYEPIITKFNVKKILIELGFFINTFFKKNKFSEILF